MPFEPTHRDRSGPRYEVQVAERALEVLGEPGEHPLEHVGSDGLLSDRHIRFHVGFARPEELQRISRAREELSALPIVVAEGAECTIEEVEQICCDEAATRPKLVVIDSFDALDYESAFEAAARLRATARAIRATVVLTCGVAPSVEERQCARPTLRDIPRALRRAADAVVALYRDEVYDKSSDRCGQAELIVMRSPARPVGTTLVPFDCETGVFGIA